MLLFINRVLNRAVPARRRRFLLLALSLALPFAPVAQAHIGSPNVFFEGPAGPYPVRVVIQPPGVVPGQAQIHVRILAGQPDKITVLPVRWDVGTKGAPPPDAATLVPGETNLFTAQLWLMRSGAYSVFVDVSGPQGHGTAVVPLDSLAYQRLTMSGGLSMLFLVLGLFLVVLLISVIGSAVRESTLPLGVQPATINRRRAVVAMVIAVVVITGAVVFGESWWAHVDANFRYNRLYQPETILPTLSTATHGLPELSLEIAPAGRPIDSTPLVPDHGHLMHLFLIRQPQGDAFAHLHPVRDHPDSTIFKTRVPALPDGEYLLYADITHESGLTQTLTNVLRLSGIAGRTNFPFADLDDAFTLAAPAAPAPAGLPGGFQLKPSLPASFRANQDVELRFAIVTDSGAPAPLEPFLGMYGHLMIQNEDATVFAHIHPLGSISMAAQKLFAEREHAGYLANQPLELLCAPPSPTLSFPYAFPRPGRYRLWLQTKLNGQIQTAPFLVKVE